MQNEDKLCRLRCDKMLAAGVLRGKMQWFYFFIIVFSTRQSFPAFSQYGDLLVPHYCNVPALHRFNWSAEQKRLVSIPSKSSKERPIGQAYAGCYQYNLSLYELTGDFLMDFNTTHALESQVIFCQNGWLFNHSTVPFLLPSAVEFSLVCDAANLQAVPVSFFILFFIVGNLSLAVTADRFGRKMVMTCGVLLLIFSGIVAGLASTFVIYVLLRSINGFAFGIISNLSFFYALELVDISSRSRTTTCYAIFSALGYLSVVPLAWWLQNWRYLHMAISFPGILVLLFIFLPESPSWLITKGKYAAAERLLKQIAHRNGHHDLITSETELTTVIENEDSVELPSHKLVHFFRNKKLVVNLLMMMTHWNLMMCIYFGTLFGNITLPGDIFVNGLCSNGVVFLTLPLGHFALTRFGLKQSAVFISICITCCLAIVTLLLILIDVDKQYETSLKWPILIFALLARAGTDFTFNLMFAYTSYLFPTQYRGFGFALCSAGGMLLIIVVPYTLLMSSQFWAPAPQVIFTLLALFDSILLPFMPRPQE